MGGRLQEGVSHLSPEPILAPQSTVPTNTSLLTDSLPFRRSSQCLGVEVMITIPRHEGARVIGIDTPV